MLIYLNQNMINTIYPKINNVFFYWDGDISPERKKILDDALYSTRYFNPDRDIYLITNSLKQEDFEDRYKILVHTWDDSIYEPIFHLPNITELKNIYNNTHPRERSDLFRLLLLSQFGGTYVDTDDIAIQTMPSPQRLINAFCASYDPHTAHYSKVEPDDCIPGRYREYRGYDDIPVFPRNDCMINFLPNNRMIGHILNDKRFHERDKEVYIGDEFSFQRLILEAIKDNIDQLGESFNLTLNLLYLFESHVGVASYWDRCWHGGPMCDIWVLEKDDERWSKYKTNKKESLQVLYDSIRKFPVVSFMWMHDKCGHPEWQLDKLDDDKDYYISTWIIDAIRSRYRTY
tara:strand:- start:4980 stop:6014 length:1035 start_codon:yes stop_codon:yes gene_type:complete